jgi:hypothetical protein
LPPVNKIQSEGFSYLKERDARETSETGDARDARDARDTKDARDAEKRVIPLF